LPWLSISTHISTLVLGLSTLALPVDCSGDFGPHGLSVQYTELAVRVCPSAHTGRPWLSVCVRQHTQDDVRGCTSVHISTLVLGLSTLALPVDCFGDYGPRGQSFQYTQDVCGCPPAHTRRLWLSVSTHRTSVAFRNVRGCPCVSVGVRQHTQDGRGCQWLSVSTHRTSGCVCQHTQNDVCGCPSAHTGHPWLSVCVRVCPYVSVSTHRTSVAVHQYTYQHAGPWTQHAGPSRGLTLTLPVDCSGDFAPRGLSVQYTQDVCGCPSAHTGRPWVSASTHRTSVAVRVCPSVSISTHRTSVAVHQYTYQHAGPWIQHAGPSRGLFG
ncbi:unnamed protein product, partial [Brassica rapa]